jgi:hypothetical protein
MTAQRLSTIELKAALHHQPGAGHPFAGLLVLDVGCPRRGPLTPMRAITKIICDRIRPLMAFGHFMEG